MSKKQEKTEDNVEKQEAKPIVQNIPNIEDELLDDITQFRTDGL